MLIKYTSQRFLVSTVLNIEALTKRNKYESLRANIYSQSTAGERV